MAHWLLGVDQRWTADCFSHSLDGSIGFPLRGKYGTPKFGVPSGKLLHNYGKIHHAIHGKILYFDWAIFNSYFDITRGYCITQHPIWKTPGNSEALGDLAAKNASAPLNHPDEVEGKPLRKSRHFQLGESPVNLAA